MAIWALLLLSLLPGPLYADSPPPLPFDPFDFAQDTSAQGKPALSPEGERGKERQAALEELAWTELRGRAEDLYKKRRMAEAVTAAEQALAVARRSPADGEARLAVSLAMLATLYGETGRAAEAERLFLEAVPEIERSMGGSHAFLAVTLNRLATLYFEAGRYREAEPLLWRALKVIESGAGRDDVGVLPLLSNLGSVEMELGRPAVAAPVLLRALSVTEAELGELSQRRLILLGNMARALAAAGKPGKALRYARDATALAEKIGGKEHIRVALGALVQARLLHQLGSEEEAAAAQRRAVQVLRARFGDEHGAVVAARLQLRDLERAAARQAPLAQLGAAVESLGSALRRLFPASRASPPRTWQDLHGEALRAYTEGRYADAVLSARRALEAASQAAPGDVARLHRDLAAFYRAAADARQAEAEYLWALQLQEALAPPQPDELDATLNQLADFYCEQSRFAAAEPLLLRSLSLQERVWGPGHARVAQALESLYLLYLAMGREKDAGRAEKRALDIRARNG